MLSCTPHKPLPLHRWSSAVAHWQASNIAEVSATYPEVNIILCKTSSGTPIALDTETGKTKWELNPDYRYWDEPSILHENKPFIVSYIVDRNPKEKSGFLHKVAIDIATGEMLWEFSSHKPNLGESGHEYIKEGLWYFYHFEELPGLCAFDLQSGKMKWKYPMLDIKLYSTTDEKTTYVFASPLSIENQTAYFTYESVAKDPNKHNYPILKAVALDLTQGIPLWSVPLEANRSPHSTQIPILRSSAVLIPFEDRVWSLNKITGEIIWKSEAFKEWGSFRELDLTPVDSDHLLVYQYNGLIQDESERLNVILLHTPSGKTLWKKDWPVSILPLGSESNYYPILSQSSLLDKYFYENFKISYLSSDKVLAQNPMELSCYNVFTGEKIWTSSILDKDETDLFQMNCAIMEDIILVTTAKEGQVLALDQATGKELWSFKDPGNQISAPLVVYKDMILIGSSWGTSYALDLKTGDILWKHKLQRDYAIQSMQFFSDTQLLVIDNEGTLISLMRGNKTKTLRGP